MTLAITESPVEGGGAALPLEPSSPGDFAFKLSLLLCFLSLTAFSALRMEIAPGIPGYPVMVRVVSDATNYPPDQLFWIERRDGTNSWWDEEIRTPTNTWWYCGTRASNAIFRAKPLLP